MVLRVGVIYGLFVCGSALGPTPVELQSACAGAAPGRFNEDCSLKRMQDTNAKAATCFEQSPSDETTFQSCCSDFCVEQSKVCTGRGGDDMCRKQCMEYGHSQFVNLQAFVNLPGAEWHSKTPAQPTKVLTQHHTSHSRAFARPSAEELAQACVGVGAGTATKECSTVRVRDTNAQAMNCFVETPSDEAAYRSCVGTFCDVQSRACTGHGGQFVCRRQCTEFARSQYVNLKAMETLPRFKRTTTTSSPPPMPSTTNPPNHTQSLSMKASAVRATPVMKSSVAHNLEKVPAVLNQHRAALRGRRFHATPSDAELNAACAQVAPGRPSDACSTTRMRHTNGKARECFQMFPSNKAKYQSCCTENCRAQSKSCTGRGGSDMCFSQCVQDSHPLFTDFKALAGVPGALQDPPKVKTLPHTVLAQHPLVITKAKVTSSAHQSWHHPASSDGHATHDPADVARLHSRR